MDDECQSPIKPEQVLMNFDDIKSTMLIGKLDAYCEDDREDLEKEYTKLWNNFINYLDCNFDSFISLTHLGKVLEFLKSKSKSIINRKKPAYLDPGNFIRL